jgi:hypothetical protein
VGRTVQGDAQLAGLFRTEGDARRRVLIRGAAVLTMDRAIPDLAKGDVLIEGNRIAAVGPTLGTAADIVMRAARCRRFRPARTSTCMFPAA